MHFNIILPSTARPSKWPLSLQHHTVCTSLICTCYMSCPTRSCFDNPHNILREVQILKILTTQSTPFHRYLENLRPKHNPHHPFSHILSLCSTLDVGGQVSHSCKTTGKFIPCVYFWKSSGKYSAPNDSNHSLTSICSQFLHKL